MGIFHLNNKEDGEWRDYLVIEDLGKKGLIIPPMKRVTFSHTQGLLRFSLKDLWVIEPTVTEFKGIISETDKAKYKYLLKIVNNKVLLDSLNQSEKFRELILDNILASMMNCLINYDKDVASYIWDKISKNDALLRDLLELIGFEISKKHSNYSGSKIQLRNYRPFQNYTLEQCDDFEGLDFDFEFNENYEQELQHLATRMKFELDFDWLCGTCNDCLVILVTKGDNNYVSVLDDTFEEIKKDVDDVKGINEAILTICKKKEEFIDYVKSMVYTNAVSYVGYKLGEFRLPLFDNRF